MTGDWLGENRGQRAAERILDAAGRVFLRHGVAAADMADIAAEAGCSRATLYRYFDNRQALRIAYMHREARRVAAQVLAEVADHPTPSARVTGAVLAAVRIVRETPVLAAWFVPEGSGATAGMAGASDVIASLCGTFLPADDAAAGKARWMVRVVVSLLAMPGRDADDERAMVEAFVTPVLLDAPAIPVTTDPEVETSRR
ncbi:MAG: TetR/AcrR family transcriptional regulator [Streptomycetaceae bacterium]|jgi:AcrR family transcriptional regulator|nr:TetR/AcrR family transcriptional regulator [Streptomycetaceae bacterium]